MLSFFLIPDSNHHKKIKSVAKPISNCKIVVVEVEQGKIQIHTIKQRSQKLFKSHLNFHTFKFCQDIIVAKF